MDIKNRHRFNLIDAFVILITLALIAGTVYFAWKENKEINMDNLSRKERREIKKAEKKAAREAKRQAKLLEKEEKKNKKK